MSDVETSVRELAKAAGCTRELSAAEVKDITRKLANSFVDNILDTPEPVQAKESANDNGKA